MLEPLLPYEEEMLLQRLDQESVERRLSKQTNRLRKKLKLRKVQRRNGIKVFDLDQTLRDLLGPRTSSANLLAPVWQPDHGAQEADPAQEARRQLLDRLQLKSDVGGPNLNTSSCSSPPLPPRIWMVRGAQDDREILSPHTGRFLRPFIRREFEMTRPLKLRLHRDLHAHFGRPSYSSSFPVDFCYLKPCHVGPINRMAQEFFWPGIDISECLQIPDFSCVAMYRKLIIGFAFITPVLSHTEAYITFLLTHPDWRRGGIAKFMLYHLIQTCAGKDITLHVSVNNPAVMLYQNFGFKVEERISNFYDKYLPPDSNDCKHALFLRLSR